jgi:predicted O-linked N-acetylglucosamine transferase (SPINDLY family)
MTTINPQIQLVLQGAIKAFESGNFDAANLILHEALKADLDSANTIFEIGIAYARASKFFEALSIFNCLHPYKKNDLRIPYNLGVIHSLQGKHQLALDAYNLALSIQPDDVEVLINKGATYNDIKNYVLALETLEKAIQIRPNIPEAWSNKGIALNNLNFYEQSIHAYVKAIQLHPGYFEAWSNKSVPLIKLKRFLEATEACDRALSLNPNYAEAYSNKGIALTELKRYDEAIANFDKALSINPNYAEAYSNKGNTLAELNCYEEAIANYDKALSFNPNIDWIPGELLSIKMKICSWSVIADSLKITINRVLKGERVIQPFALLALHDNPLVHKQASEIFAQAKYPFNSVLGEIARRPKGKKIRVAYFSADFRNHPVAHLTAELYEAHDRSKFEVFAFSLTKPSAGDEMSLRLKNGFDRFIDVEDLSDQEIAQLARDLNIDIAIDLSGLTQHSRTGIFSYRAAPIQVNWLGYPGTIGVEFIDYILADKTIIPNEFQSHYSEQVVCLPNCYQVNDRKRLISNRQFSRREMKLPENGFVFCCFNNNYKIMPAMFDCWMKILKAVEGSVLWLLQDNPSAAKNLQKEAFDRGVNGNRLIFAERLPLSEHLSRYHLADLFLDTFPYNAHTTASDALWTGLPVLTLIGQSFAGRVAASLLNAIELPELITNTQEEYEALAISLAMNPQKLSDIKLKLTNNILTTPLFNTPLFTKNIEATYVEMYERYQVDLRSGAY